MTRYIKVQFLRNGQPTGREYTYKTDLDVQLGEIVMVTEKAKGIVTSFTPEILLSDIDKVKEIYGRIPKGDEE